MLVMAVACFQCVCEGWSSNRELMQVSFFVISQSYVVIVNCQFAVNCKDEIVVIRWGLQLCYTSLCLQSW